jgi:ribose-phosphate pyrophosphokinase
MTFTLYEQRRKLDGGTALVRSNHKAFQFPGAEAHVVLEPTATVQVAYVQGADGNDLFKLAMWADACKRTGGLTTVLALPYLPGARQDRGAPLGAKVYADFINSLGIDHVVCVDPHSDVAPALYDRLTVVPITEVIALSAAGFQGVIVPDLGARKRAEAVAAKLDLPIYQATKHRDFATGKLSSFECEPLPEHGDFLVVDDICDGGGTFLGLADTTGLHRTRLGLWVTHGIFSNGALGKLFDKYSWIASTDSHPGAPEITHFGATAVYTRISILNILINHVKDI